MSPRLQRLATDWKTALAGLGIAVSAGLAAATELVNKLALAIAGVKDLPSEAKWLAAALLAALAVLALVSALGRRSTLLRPERFVISADDPEHLVGRDDEVKALAKACEQNALVFLQGESGAGKSALVQGGLLPQYQATRAGNEAAQLLPIRIDASPLAWDNGLRIELARAIRGLSADERAQLGAATAVDSDDAFPWLSALPLHASRQMLLVLDQIDDYAVAHQAGFVRGHTVVAPEQFEEANADWAAIGSLVRKGSIHLLIVCRADAAGILDALRFTRARTILLPRIDQQLISPILDRVTQADERAPVVADPEHGWLQLKAQLLRDLAAGGSQILPVQLAIGLDSVRRFRSLTPAEYAKNGGVRGLERLHIERHLHDAAGAAGLGDDALLRGLACLVTENGLKTQRATLQEFAQAIGVTGPGATALETAVEHLIRWRILRRQSGAEGEYLLLHHDYLARGVREVQRQANYWVELLRERTRELEEAFGWRQRWRSLLPLIAQARLFWGRLRGRFRYGEHRRLAFWSTLRLLPVAVALAVITGAGWWVDRANQQQLAERVLAGISSGTVVSRDEAQEWRQLAGARWPARFHAVRIALSRPSIARKAIETADLLAHAAVGLDPTGELSRQLARETILSALDQRPSTLFVARGAIAGRLRHTRPEARDLARGLVKLMKAEQNSHALSSLGLALARLSGKLEAKEVRPGAAALVEQMKRPGAFTELSNLGLALAGLSGKLEAEEVRPGAAALVEQMKREKDSEEVSLLGHALAGLSDKLETKDVQPGAAVVVERMQSEQDGYVLVQLSEALAGLSGKLEAKEVRSSAAALVERMKTEHDTDALWDLGEALAELSGSIEAKDVQPLAAALVERMKTEHDTDALFSLGETLAGLSGKLEAKDAQAFAVALVERMKTEHDSDALDSLHEALTWLSGWIEAKDVQPRATALAKRMEREQDGLVLSMLGKALAGLGRKLEAQDLQRAATALGEAMKTSERVSFAQLSRMATAWVMLERVAYTDLSLQKRVQAYVDLLRLPLVVGGARKALLDGLEQLTGEKFEGDLWRFVDWATESDKGKALRLDLGGP